MALNKENLKLQLYTAFSDAMKEFIKISSASGIKDSQKEAISSASNVFSSKASSAIDLYLKSVTIITPPGQIVVTPSGPGTTTTPSLPASIS